MIAVIPIGRGRPATLPYVLRSLVQNARVTELVTVGERPEGIEPDRHIDSPNAGAPHVNIMGHLRRLDLDEPFVWIDDDTFTMKPWTPAVYVAPYSIAKMLRTYPNRGPWSQAVRNSIKVMQEWGYDPEHVPAGTIHRPWLVDHQRVRMVLDALDRVKGGSFKALYPAGLDDVIEAGNPKILGHALLPPDAEVVSVFNDSWKRNCGRQIREIFTEPTRWESAPIESMALASSGRAVPRHRRHRG